MANGTEYEYFSPVQPSIVVTPDDYPDDFRWTSLAGSTVGIDPKHDNYSIDSQVMAGVDGTRFLEKGHAAFPKPDRPKRKWFRWMVIGVILGTVIATGLYFGIPEYRWMMSTVSTDDAFVSGHLTNVGARVDDVVIEVFVDQYDRVEPGMLLARLDREPFEISVAQSEASLQQARASLIDARARVKGQLATARGNWYRRKSSQEQLRRQVATLKAEGATLEARLSSFRLAEVDQKRIGNLAKQGSATQSELDTRNNTLEVARQNVKEAWAAIQETRASLGLAPDYEHPLEVPRDLEQSQSTVQSSVSDVASTLAQVGLTLDLKDVNSTQAFNDFLKKDPGDSNESALDHVIENAPGVRIARASVEKAGHDLDNAKLELSWTEIRAEISGYIQDRSVHPGDRVEKGQTLLSIRPDYVWVSANYKETQIHYFRIGHPVDIYVDAYPKSVFKGRVAGFSPGTGLSLSLLPPENATGNYVKVTQRLPVRIELVEPIPAETPLYAGLSVVPYVRFQESLGGPGAGQRLHDFSKPSATDTGGGPASLKPGNRVKGPSR